MFLGRELSNLNSKNVEIIGTCSEGYFLIVSFEFHLTNENENVSFLYKTFVQLEKRFRGGATMSEINTNYYPELVT